VGDDLTDEDMFKVLPEDAYSVKIGFTPSKARFYLGSPKEVRALLDEMEMVEVYK
jgi:trehalose 6-phosphate synthase/phosphatase